MSFLTLSGSNSLSGYTTTTFIQQLRYRVNESTASFWSDVELLAWINQGVADIFTKTLCLGTSENVTLAADTLLYSLTTLRYVAPVALLYNSAKGLLAGDPSRVGRIYDIGEPQEFFHFNGQIGIYPVPATGSTPVGKLVTVYLAQAPAAIVAGASIPLPVLYDIPLMNYLAAQALYKDEKEQKGDRFMAEYNALVDRYRVDFNERQGGQQ